MFKKKKAIEECRLQYASIGKPDAVVTKQDLWHWFLLTGNGERRMTSRLSGGELAEDMFYNNPWTVPSLGIDIVPSRVSRSSRILVCSSNLGFQKMGIVDLRTEDPKLPPSLQALCEAHKISPESPVYLSRDIAQFWYRFYGCREIFSEEEPMSAPSIIITDGEMRHYVPEGMYFGVGRRLKKIARAHRIPIEFV